MSAVMHFNRFNISYHVVYYQQVYIIKFEKYNNVCVVLFTTHRLLAGIPVTDSSRLLMLIRISCFFIRVNIHVYICSQHFNRFVRIYQVYWSHDLAFKGLFHNIFLFIYLSPDSFEYYFIFVSISKTHTDENCLLISQVFFYF